MLGKAQTKHISASLDTIEFYGRIGEFKLNKTCIETLQTWHHPKCDKNFEKVSVDEMLYSAATDTPNSCSSRTGDLLNSMFLSSILPAYTSRQYIA